MKAIGRIFSRFNAAIENAKRQNVATMNPEKRPEYDYCYLSFLLHIKTNP